jgi:hypothetical protein
LAPTVGIAAIGFCYLGEILKFAVDIYKIWIAVEKKFNGAARRSTLASIASASSRSNFQFDSASRADVCIHLQGPTYLFQDAAAVYVGQVGFRNWQSIIKGITRASSTSIHALGRAGSSPAQACESLFPMQTEQIFGW